MVRVFFFCKGRNVEVMVNTCMVITYRNTVTNFYEVSLGTGLHGVPLFRLPEAASTSV